MPWPWRSYGVAMAHRRQQRAELADQGHRPTNKGEPMQTQYLIFAGAIAACGILYLLLKYTDDPIAKQIQEAQQYEGKQKRIKKAIEK
jgi:hypothetical protein